MVTDLEELRGRSHEFAEQLNSDEAMDVDAAILDLEPGDLFTTNRLGIGLLKSGARTRRARGAAFCIRTTRSCGDAS